MELDELIRLRNNGLPCIPVATPSAKEAERLRLQKQTKEFLARGGQVEEVHNRPIRTEPIGAFNNQPPNKQNVRNARRRNKLTFGAQA